MQSVGHAGSHKPHPTQCSANTSCNFCGAPIIASVGHTGKHNAQPTQSSARMCATGIKRAGGIGGGGMFIIDAKRDAVSAPPGGHKFIGASSFAIASA